MRRIQAFEIEDAEWFPGFLRNYMTDYLGAAVARLDLFAPAIQVIDEGLRRSGERRVVDLASGGGRVWRRLAPALRRRYPELEVRLTDANPNLPAMMAASAEHPDVVSFESRRVDAEAVPPNLLGLRTMFLAFHHFRPVAAERILKDAVACGQPLAIFEGQRRDLRHLIQFALSPLAVLLLTPGLRPVRAGRLLFTYLIPIVPLLVGWDGVISVLRTYTVDEMRSMAASADPLGRFVWHVGELASGRSVVPYLLGVPKAQARSVSPATVGA